MENTNKKMNLGPRITIIEDDEDIAEIMKTILTKKKFLVQTFTDTAQAYKSISDNKPELIITDLSIPGIDGTLFVKKLIARKMKVPILLVSGRNDLKKIAENVGADAYLPKPFDLKTLVSVVQKIIK